MNTEETEFAGWTYDHQAEEHISSVEDREAHYASFAEARKLFMFHGLAHLSWLIVAILPNYVTYVFP